ncbi:uncharacterized protein LOC116931540 [Daphnia magna]|uniref:G-protein coupled receptors family 1 profile domain-containing protein n=1 Tax=Daphnia magna TaxID=35525 RepID=A0ABQ9ZJ22_9CRUS|nr:uncharacterized protein LOC116931540 [Daphnia magna]KAK4012921.1 hypothetical protein OUZ56_025170 [Daphnia magna]
MEALPDNEAPTEMDSSAMLLLAEGFVFLLSLLRIFVVSLVLAVNIIALRRCSSRNSKCHCLYLYVSDSVKICSVVYIASWIPFLLYSMLNGRWLLIDKQIFCLIQNYMTNAVLLVLLAMAALASLSKTQGARSISPKSAAGLTLAAWILPQFAYFVILTSLDTATVHKNEDFYLLDDLLGMNDKSTLTTGIRYTVGFTICGHSLCRMAMTQYVLQYVIIILPTCVINGIIYIRNKHRLPLTQPNYRYSEQLIQDKGSAAIGCPSCSCGRGITSALEIILFGIVLWLLLIRPMIVFIWSPEHLFDLGSHILLSITAVFTPILPKQKSTRHVKIFRIDPLTAISRPNNEHDKNETT